jgi:undecaprenyl-diphosphatase
VELDESVFRAIYGHGPRLVLVPLMILVSALGSGFSLLWLLPLVWRRASPRHAVNLMLAIAVVAVLVWSIKLGVGRIRPWQTFGVPYLAPFAPRDNSCPSGHAAGAFCVLGASLAMGHRARYAWAVGGAAAAIAYSRVYLGAHYPGDVVLGAVVGASVGWAVVTLRQRFTSSRDKAP